MNRRLALALIACALPLGGCFQPQLYNGPLDDEPATPYRLASGDRLRIIVFGQNDLSNLYAVDGSGRISMPLIGEVAVAGYTTLEAERTIAARLRKGFIREPKVTVDVDTYRPFFVLGEVNSSGQYPYVNGMSAQTAVAIAGGFTPRADRTYAELTRRTPEGLVTANVPIIYPVKPGDTIVIRERWF